MATGGNGDARAGSPVTTISSRAGSQRSAHTGPQSTSHLESTITRLLVATKQLLEGLARWSRREVDENAISEIYVKLGNDFNVACAAFAREGITMNELLSVPSDLRVCLETCLSDQPSQATLERHLPQVRQIIIGLLHGLREKQRLYREGVAARRQREATRTAPVAFGANAASAPGLSTLTPTSANRSRDDLRRFVTQAQQVSVGPTASTSSSSVGANDPGPRARYDLDGPSGVGGTAARRSASDQAFPASATAGGGTESRPPTAMSSRAGGSLRTGSLRDSTRSSANTSASSRRPTQEDAFGPVQSPPPIATHASVSSSGTGNRLTRSASSTSLDNQSVPARAGSPSRPGLERSATTSNRVMMSPPPARRRDDAVPALPPTPAVDTFGPVVTASSSASSLSALPNPFARSTSAASLRSLQEEGSTPVPRQPPQQHVQTASLEALRADNLSRRASKRYSAYAIQKMTSPSPSPASAGGGSAGGAGGASGGSVGGPSPSPSSYFGQISGMEASSDGWSGATSSAGRELAGVDAPRRSKSEYLAGSSSRSAAGGSSGHHRSNTSSSRRDNVPPLPPIPKSYTAAGLSAVAKGAAGSPITEEDGERSVDGNVSPRSVRSPPTFPPPPVPVQGAGTSRAPKAEEEARSAAAHSPSLPAQTTPTTPSHVAASVVSLTASEAEYPCSVFLQIGRNVKKARLESPPEIASLRQLFVERFGYNPGLGEWPDIYLRDADSGVHYELEEMSEIRAGSVLSLNVDSVEQVKTHIDHGLSALAQDIKELRATVSAIRAPALSTANGFLSPSHRDSVATLSGTSPHLRPSPSERDFQNAAQRVLHSQTPSRATTSGEAEASPAPADAQAPASESTPTASAGSEAPVVDTLKSQHADVQTLRREIGVLRQVYADWTSQTKEMFASVRVQTSHVQHLAKTKLSTDRSFVEAGTARLDSESTDLVVKVDELQDTIEQLRADTVKGVKPRPQTLSETASALRKAVETRQKLSGWLKEVKPTWSQMWSNELGKILGEQKAVEQQETLLGELDEDLEDVAKVFKNIQAVATQLKASGLGARTRERDYGGADNAQEGLSTVLMEVKALSPDPSKRLEAIARAEKQRQAELASRTDEFAEELGDFVGKGRLKKSGGIEETERIRQARSEATLRNMFQG